MTNSVVNGVTYDVTNDVKNETDAMGVVTVRIAPKPVYCDHKQILELPRLNAMTHGMDDVNEKWMTHEMDVKWHEKTHEVKMGWHEMTQMTHDN